MQFRPYSDSIKSLRIVLGRLYCQHSFRSLSSEKYASMHDAMEKRTTRLLVNSSEADSQGASEHMAM